MKSNLYLLIMLLGPVTVNLFCIVGADNFGEVLLCASPLLIFIVLVSIGTIQYQAQRKGIHREALSKGVPVRYCTESKFGRFWRFFPWESSGLLVAQDDGVLEYQSNDCATRLAFQPGNRRIRWVGSKLAKGAICWFQIESAGESYFFAYNSGATVIFSHELTKSLFDLLKNNQ